MYRIYLLITFWGLTICGYAQEDPLLFEVGDQKVNVSEFEYIYNKNNGDNADYSKSSLEEYLELYIKYKLKVQKAIDMGLDTVEVLQQELETYRKQLANSFLSDKEVVNKLVEEAYNRMQTDVNLAHILVNISNPKGPRDTFAAYREIHKAKDLIDQGQPFESVARKFSDDQATAKTGGVIGYITAMLPDGFYNLEKSAYELPIGKLSNPIRTNLGYHLIKVLDRRPARGEVEVAHILIRKQKGKEELAKAKIDSVYQLLKNGNNFAILATKVSEDKNSARNGGNIGIIKINQYDDEFEDVAFSLVNDGDFSQPVETRVGWHIIKRLSKNDNQTLEQMRPLLKARIERDSRSQIAKNAIISKIQNEAEFSENPDNYNYFRSLLDSTFLTYRWRIPGRMNNMELFTFGGDISFTTQQFATFLFKNTRERMRLTGRNSIDNMLREMYKRFKDESTLAYEEKNLKNKYPEFKNLMREYEEGILLFEATKILVWDKASTDTTGLKAYFANHRNDFMWDERGDLYVVSIQTADQKLLKKIIKKIKKKPLQDVLQKYNQPEELIVVSGDKVEKGGKAVENIKWGVKATTEPAIDAARGVTSLQLLEKIYPPEPKSLNEARGYVIADYQDHLEKEWVKELKSIYEIKVNTPVFESLIKE